MTTGSTSEPHPTPPAGDATANAPLFGDRYRLVRHIARGGMAQVYLAQDTLLDRPVALKVLFPELSVDENFVQRFRREARAAANLTHPNIVSIYDWGQGEHTYFIVMEFVDGETLSTRIRRGPMPPDQAAIVAIATAGALSFAHRRQVIHRDVKPGNVLIDRSGQVKVADFGIARAIGTAEDLTQAGSVMGTATYFSPEQAQGLAVDARSDVYSLGVVLYEMVAGKPPFQADTPVAIAYKHVREAPAPLRELNGACPAAYAAITAKAMAKDPADRYQTADDLRADLERFRAGQPVLAADPDAGADGDTTTVMAGAASTVMAADPTRVAAATALGPPVEPVTAVPDRSSRAGWWVLLVAILVIALGVLVYFVGRDAGLFGGAKTETIPKVAGQPTRTAESRLRAAGFKSFKVGMVTASSVPKGDVVKTVPPGGSRLETNRTVTLDVSAGPPNATVPPVAGDPQSAAKTDLVAAGFPFTVTLQPSSTVPAGHVVRTIPAGGTSQAKGSRVNVIISTGPKLIAIPALTGKTPAAAAVELATDGFTVGNQINQSSSSVPSGDVIGTSPPAGEQKPAGTTVNIYVSNGVSVPDLVGRTESAAQAALQNLGLNPVFTPVTVTNPSENGIVLSTDPAAGTPVAAGDTVTVSIGSYAAPATTTVPPSSTTAPPTSSGTSGPSGTSGASGTGPSGQGRRAATSGAFSLSASG